MDNQSYHREEAETPRLLKRWTASPDLSMNTRDEAPSEGVFGERKYRYMGAGLMTVLLCSLAVVAIPSRHSPSLSASSLYTSTTTTTTSTTTSSSTSTSSTSSYSSASTSSEDLRVYISTPGYSEPLSLAMLPWDTIAEPYKSQTATLVATSSLGDSVWSNADDYTVSWTMCEDTDYEFSLSGLTTTFTLNMPAGVVCNCSVAVVSEAQDVQIDVNFRMAVKYLRRELRTLSDEDRNTFLTALNTMYTLNEKDGQALYGSKYHDADYYSAKHLNGAGTSDCDHWHDGAGLLVHHMAFTLMVEQTLQAINPSIAMPYWEYAMDSELFHDDWESSDIFQPDWFGEEPKTNEHTIQDGGIWQGIGVGDADQYSAKWDQSSTGSMNPFSNAYGMLRSPWNNNPSRLIGRSNTTYGMSQYQTMPTCSTLKACFESDSLADVRMAIVVCFMSCWLMFNCLVITVERLLEWRHPWTRSHHDWRSLGR
jgi:hypothetical protein